MKSFRLGREFSRLRAGVVTAAVAVSCGGSAGSGPSSGGPSGGSTGTGGTTGSTSSGAGGAGGTTGSMSSGAGGTAGSTSSGAGGTAGSTSSGAGGTAGSMASGGTSGSTASGAGGTTGSTSSGATTGSSASGTTGSSAGGTTGSTASGAAGSTSDAGAYRSRYVFSVKGTQTLLNGTPVIAKGFRLSNSLVSDAAANAAIAQFDTYVSYGINIVSAYFQGSRYTKVVGYLPDASLDPAIAARMGRIIEAADARGMIVVVGCLYYGGAGSTQPGWTQTDADNAIANTTRWAKSHSYRNVFFDPDNEGMASSTFSDPALVMAGTNGDPNAVMAINHGSPCDPSADLCIHIAAKDPARPYIQTEGIAQGWSYGNGNYTAPVGVFSASQETSGENQAHSAYSAGEGWMLASMWLQAAPPLGPNPNFGGDGLSANTAGVAWWADWLKTTYGAYVPPAPLP